MKANHHLSFDNMQGPSIIELKTWGSFEIMANVHHVVDESFFNLKS